MPAAISRLRKRRKLKSEINVVPYIDVMLVLLIIFMVTAPLLTLSTDVNLPTSNAKALESKQDPVIVTVKPDGRLGLQLPEEKITREMSVDQLRALLTGLAEQDKDVRVVIAGDKDAPYQKIMDAMDVIKAAKIDKVGMISGSGGNAR